MSVTTATLSETATGIATAPSSALVALHLLAAAIIVPALARHARS